MAFFVSRSSPPFPFFACFCETIRFFLDFASNGLDNGLKLYYSFYSIRLFGR